MNSLSPGLLASSPGCILGGLSCSLFALARCWAKNSTAGRMSSIGKFDAT